jgi:hypothetical protein
VIQTPPDPAVWVVTTLLSAFAIVLLMWLACAAFGAALSRVVFERV